MEELEANGFIEYLLIVPNQSPVLCIGRVKLMDMSTSDPVQCPSCGWTGDVEELVADGEEAECPICSQDIEVME